MSLEQKNCVDKIIYTYIYTTVLYKYTEVVQKRLPAARASVLKSKAATAVRGLRLFLIMNGAGAT
jgi:DNA-binding HxlR family transcriptional regulator